MKTLIAYTTTHGAAAECARKIAALTAGPVDVVDLKRNPAADPAPYGKVILGCSVYGGAVQKAARRYCRTYQSELLKKPMGIFFSCLSDDEKSLRAYLERNFPPEIVRRLAAGAALGGAFYFTAMNPAERFASKIIAGFYARSHGIAAPDGKSDFIAFSEEKIAAFADRMNRAEGGR
ncbi:MAG TPA: hypothetical protein DEB16_03125 [Ruminococcaceae bacterium]|jgi:menaquinone-dependent protoporphyrinogen oxidase|nr:hypothetical protein [Oscillospiraceae bacterium]HBT90822.1 hypothetical protein [Oscillospiraceae bacterium]HCB90882.1 hypothetical protein [Oscillospiraceae bacterium]